MKKNRTHHLNRIGLQWNLGRKMHSWPASRITLSSTEIWLANLVYWECVPCSNHCSQTDRRVCIWHEGDPHWSRALREFAGALFSPQIPSSSFGLCHGILEMGWIMVSFCLRCTPPFDLFISKASSASGMSRWLIEIKRAWHLGCSFMWEESVANFGRFLRPEMLHLGFFFGGIVDMWVFWIQIKYLLWACHVMKKFEMWWTHSVY